MLCLQLQDGQWGPEFVTGHAEQVIIPLLRFRVDKRIEYHMLPLHFHFILSHPLPLPGSGNGELSLDSSNKSSNCIITGLINTSSLRHERFCSKEKPGQW